MKPTTGGQWCHIMCAMWTPETGFQDPLKREPIEGVDKVGEFVGTREVWGGRGRGEGRGSDS
jgi:hypothetical protein